jgi:hypothetical protein
LQSDFESFCLSTANIGKGDRDKPGGPSSVLKRSQSGK